MCLSLRKTSNAELLEKVILEILRYHEVENFDVVYKERGDELLLVDDLGLDSLTLTEIAFDAEDFLEISISNEQMMGIKNPSRLEKLRQKSCSVDQQFSPF